MTTVSVGDKSTFEGQIRSYFLGRVALAAGGFVTVPLLSRALGMQNYGKLSLWLTLTTWLPLVLGGWLQQSILRYHQEYMSWQATPINTEDRTEDNQEYNRIDSVKHPGSSDAYCDTVQKLVVMLVSGATLASWLTIALLLPHQCSPSEGICIALITGASLINIALGARAQAELQASLVVTADFVRTVLPIVLVGAMVMIHMPCHQGEALFAFLVGLVGADLLLYCCVRRPVSKASPSVGRKQFSTLAVSMPVVRRMLGFGLPMGIWFGLTTGQTLIGRLLLEHYGKPQHLAIFTGLQDFLTKTGTVLFMPVTYALHSRVMKLWAEARHGEATDAIRRAYLYQGGLAILLMLSTVGMQRPLCQFLFGRAGTLQGSQESLSLVGLVFALVLSIVLSNVGLIAHKGLELGERTRIMALSMGLATLFNVVSGRMLVVPFGAVGIAWSLVIANGFYLVASVVGSRRVLIGAVSIVASNSNSASSSGSTSTASSSNSLVRSPRTEVV